MGYPDIWGINKGSIFLDKENRAIVDKDLTIGAIDRELEYYLTKHKHKNAFIEYIIDIVLSPKDKENILEYIGEVLK